jgi:methionine-R-sulfoxide reductase
MLNWADVLKMADHGNPDPSRRVEREDDEWRTRLTPDQYRVTRRKGTERPFSSEMCSLFEPGLYACVCCDTLLFDSEEKFESDTGWPSFTQPIEPRAVAYHGDDSHGMRRVETTCNVCDAHLGHVFPDGPPPSGLRTRFFLRRVIPAVRPPCAERPTRGMVMRQEQVTEKGPRRDPRRTGRREATAVVTTSEAEDWRGP